MTAMTDAACRPVRTLAPITEPERFDRLAELLECTRKRPLELEVRTCVGAVIGEPGGVPASIADTIPPSNTPARSQPRISFNIRRSHTRRSI